MFRAFAAAWLIASLVGAPFAVAELPLITLTSVMPPGGKTGTETDVVIAGNDLEEASALHFSHPGITAKVKADKTFTVAIAPEVPVGIYDVRVSGRSGVSNPRAFAVGDLPELVKKEENTKPETAVALPINTVFNGAVTAAADSYFRFTAQKGQRLFVECLAPEIDSRLTPVIAVLDQSTRELAANRRGAPLDFIAPSDGPFHVRLHDLAYGGGPEHIYRLTISSGPRLDFIFPPSAPTGTKCRFTLFGRNLPGSAPANLATIDGEPLEKLEVELDLPTANACDHDGLMAPESAAVEGLSYRLKTPQGTSNPVFISFATDPVIAECEPNNQPTQAQKLTPPCEVVGQFFPAGDADSFSFDAKKGDAYWIEIISQRLGLATNPFLLVQRDNADLREDYGRAEDAGGKRFSTGMDDPAWRFEVKEDGAYRIKIRDLFGGTRNDPRNVYRLVLRKEASDFRLAALIEPPIKKQDDRTTGPWSTLLRGGETIPLRVVVFRRDGFSGDIELGAESLPEGVSCASTRIPSGRSDGVLLLTAAEKAAQWVGPIRIVGRTRIGEGECVRDARSAVVIWNVGNYDEDSVPTRLTRDITIAVSGVETSPLTVEPAEDKVWEAATGGKLEIPLRVTRRGEMKQDLKVTAHGAPAIEGFKDFSIDAKAETVTATMDLAAIKVPAGAYTIYFSGPTKVRFRDKDMDIIACSAPIRIQVK
ncbi:MAG TPA: hypothetical protein VFD27_21575 [Chthoniobacteraceae bacterium]|nr:hypothetical protein [Chthoniobacteraceae bacterium]